MQSETTKIIGYKVTDKNMQCIGYQYELNKKFTLEGKIRLCSTGFHFCLKVNDCFNYYSFNPENRVFEIEAGGTTDTEGGDKMCSSEITFLREISWSEVLEMVNTGKANTGYSNSGNWNSGDSNSGDRNSGYSNSGNWNSGNWNSGDRNSGDSNSGNWNSGDSNSGNWNSGDSNSGNWNSGDSNSGNWNSGDRNSGNWNSGDRNSGDSNSGYRNSGAFCTADNPELILFNKSSGILVRDWERSEAVSTMRELLDFTIWIPASKMTEEEKKQHPKYETTEGYLKTIPLKEAWQNMWHQLTDKKKAVFTSLPNFDSAIFFSITGIKL